MRQAVDEHQDEQLDQCESTPPPPTAPHLQPTFSEQQAGVEKDQGEEDEKDAKKSQEKQPPAGNDKDDKNETQPESNLENKEN